ncbi:MAG: phosphotransferase family protein [Halanaeroarchaeum sp.]
MADVDGLDPSLRSYLERELGEPERVAVEGLGGGYSNETLVVAWDDRDLVIRRPPGDDTAESAHDVLREYRVMDALQETSVPVPETVLKCEDTDVVGSEFYVMERIAGDVIRTEEPERFATPRRRQQLGEAFVDTLAAIHDVDYGAVGLEDFGRPRGYLDRQIGRWWNQIEWARERTASVRRVEDLEAVADWLENNVPAQAPPAIVHGDYKLDNVLFAPGDRPAVAGVLDWEMSTVGDPLTDLAWVCLYWHEAGDPDPPIPSVMPSFTAREGYPDRRTLVERYEAATGTTFENPRFYQVLAHFKMAAIGEMFFRRYREGADVEMYARMERAVPVLAERALAIVEGEGVCEY